ncbi:MAG: hypothetical protein JRC90_10475 [Deltaproteobacteria bacterium]|nr:hypothetical protein [Deltaproteobacteria bacterium]
MKQKTMPICEEYDPSRGRSDDLDHNVNKSERELGYIKDENGSIYSPGSSERRNTWGEAVSHQDGRSNPRRRDF